MKLLNLAFGLVVPTLFGACTQRDANGPSAAQQFASADPAPSAAQSDRPVSIDVNLNWLARNSPFVFVGHLTGKSVEKDARGLVVTKHRFDVDNIILGESQDKVVALTTLGGTMNGETLKVTHMPEFAEGQTYVVFTDLTRTVYNPVTGNRNGVFLVVDSAIYTYDGRALVGVEDGLLRVGDRTLENPPDGKDRRAAASEAGNPNVSGGVVSAERAAVESGIPMRLEEFSRAIVAAARR